MTREVIQALRQFPQTVQATVERFAPAERIEEIRFRIGRPMQVRTEKKTTSLPLTVTRPFLDELTDRAAQRSTYATQQMLQNGFLILPGGHRLGLSGTAVMQNGAVQTLRLISSANLRIARALPGIAEGCAARLWTHPASTLLFGAPGSGKTTLLRDLIRLLSDRQGKRICVVDERLELAACLDGAPQFDLGENTDVLSGAAKECGIALLLRSMNPEWIALDEITAAQDVEAVVRASYCGVRFLATAHAASREELLSRPLYRSLMQAGVFRNLICIRPDHSVKIEKEGPPCSD